MTSDTELPLEEFGQLERVALPPKPKFRVAVDVAVKYHGYISYQTEEDPEEWLELDDNVQQGLDDIVGWGSPDPWDWDVDYGRVEVSYDHGRTWGDWKRER